MSPRKLNRRSASLRNGSREIEIIFPFCEFSRLCEGDNFRLAVAATVGSTIAIEPAGDSRRRSSHVENARIVSDANRALRLPRWSETFGWLPSGFARYRDSFPILCFFKALQGGKFPIRSRRRSPLPRGRRSAMAGIGRGLPPTRPRRALASPHARERAPSRGARRLDLNAVVMRRSATRDVKRVDLNTLARIRFLRKEDQQKSTPPVSENIPQ
jgi:hypothetical protein